MLKIAATCDIVLPNTGARGGGGVAKSHEVVLYQGNARR